MALLAHENDRKGLLGTILFHVLLLLILLITGFGSVPPLESDNGGVMVSFGDPDAGGGDVRPAASQVESAPQPQSSDPNESVITSDDEAPEVVKQEKTPNQTKTKPTPQTKPTTQEEVKPSIDPRLKAQLEKMKRDRENGGSGIGEGTKPGDKGREDGQDGGYPDGTGKGNLGNGISYNLKGFSVSGSPNIKNNTQKTGTIVVEVCVDKLGRIVSTKLGRGSTTTDNYLYELSENAVRELRIKPVGTTNDTNCGTVTIVFERH